VLLAKSVWFTKDCFFGRVIEVFVWRGYVLYIISLRSMSNIDLMISQRRCLSFVRNLLILIIEDGCMIGEFWKGLMSI
jgi:hypothetical protein